MKLYEYAFRAARVFKLTQHVYDLRMRAAERIRSHFYPSQDVATLTKAYSCQISDLLGLSSAQPH
jgi:hypothetical protein